MAQPLRVSQGQDFVAVLEGTATTTSAAAAFVSKDGPQWSSGSKTFAILAEEIVIQNRDATNDLIVRLASPLNESVASGLSAQTGAGQGQSAPQQMYPLIVDTSKFPAAVAGDIRVPKGATITVHAKAVGVTLISSAATVAYTIIAVGPNYTTA